MRDVCLLGLRLYSMLLHGRYTFPFFSFCILALPDIVPDIDVLRRDMRLSIVPMQYLRCPLEENCLSDSAGYVIR